MFLDFSSPLVFYMPCQSHALIKLNNFPEANYEAPHYVIIYISLLICPSWVCVCDTLTRNYNQ